MALHVGFVTGATPDKWAQRWRERFREPLLLTPLAPDQQSAFLLHEGDMVIARMPLGLAEETIFAVPLYSEDPVLVVSKEHWLSLADSVASSSLGDEELLSQSELACAPSIKDIFALVAADRGVYQCPASVARLYARKDVVTVPVSDLPPTEVKLCWLREADSELAQRFVGIVKGRTARTSRS